jgi:cytochrome P450
MRFPLPRRDPFAPPPEYERLRAEEPVSKVTMLGGNQAWLVTRHQDVLQALSDPTLSVNRRQPGFPRFAPITEVQRKESFRDFRPPLNWMDPPEHARARRSVAADFTAAQARCLRARAEQIADESVDRMLAADGPVDLVQALSLPVPSRIICEILGVPYAGHEYFEMCTTRMLGRATPAAERTRAAHGIRAHLDAVVAAHEREPGEGLLGRLAASDGADHEEIVSMAFVLLVAGHVTTSNMISLGVLGLLTHPDQADAVLDRPAGAVDELLRYFTIVEAATSRTAIADTQVGGVPIRAGEGVVALGQTANRDPEVFRHPAVLNLSRDAGRHVSFGHGRHICLGRHLARMELEVVFGALLRRSPRLRLAIPADQVPVKWDANVYGLHQLPVTC